MDPRGASVLSCIAVLNNMVYCTIRIHFKII